MTNQPNLNAEIFSQEILNSFSSELMEQSPVSIQVHSPVGKLVASNSAFAKLYALNTGTLKELYEKYNILQDEQAVKLGVMPFIKKVFSGEVAFFPEYEYDGIDTLKTLDINKPVSRKCWVQTHGFPIKDKKGKVSYAVFMSEDITARKMTEIALKNARLFTDDLIETANVMIIGLDKDGKINLFNRAAEQITGYTLTELKDKNWFETLVPKDNFPHVHEEFNRIMEGGVPKLFQNPILTKDGDERYITWTNTEIKQDDEPIGLLSFGIDITDQKIAEEERNKLFNLSIDLIGIAGFDGVFKQLNPAWEITLGYTLEELMTKPFFNFIHTDDQKKTEAEMGKLVSGKTTIDFENRYIHKNGSIRYISWTATPMPEQGLLYCTGRDITERKTIEEALIESEEKFRLLVEQSPYSIQIFKPDGYLDQINEAFKELWGVDGDALKEVLDNYNVLNDEEARKLGISEAIQQAFKGESIVLPLIEYDAESTLNSAGVEVKANKRWIQARLYPVKNSSGEVVSVVDMEEDMTEVMLKEKKILNYQTKLKALTTELTLSEEKQRQVIATDLHDQVGQLLASSRLQIAALTEKLEKQEILDKLKHISQGLLQGIQATRNAIFELSSPQLNEIGLIAAVSDWMDEELENKHGIKTTIIGDSRILPIKEDISILLFRCVRELLMNVIKHAKATKVNLNFSGNYKSLKIVIEDNGVGFQYNPAMLRVKGSGFGLFSIQERVEGLGGSMEIKSMIGKGTTIILILPLS